MEELRKRIKEKIKLEDEKTLDSLLRILNKAGIRSDSVFNKEDRNVSAGNEINEILYGTREQRVQLEYNAAIKKIVDHLERDVLCDQTTDTNQTTSTAGAHTASENAESSE